MFLSAEIVVSVIWDPAWRKARAKLYSEKWETQSSCSVPSHFLTSACLLCHLCHSFAISWGAEFLSMTNQSCCFWLLHRYCGLLRNHWLLQSSAVISGPLTGEGYLHSNQVFIFKRGNTEVFRRNTWKLFRRKCRLTGSLQAVLITYHWIIAIGTQVITIPPAVTNWD